MPRALRAKFRITPLGAADRGRKSVWRPCRRKPPRSSRRTRSTCADDDEVWKRQAASAPGKPQHSRRGLELPGAFPRSPARGRRLGEHTRKWVGGKYIRRPIVRAGVSNRPRGRGHSRRPAGRASMHSRRRPGCPITRRPSGSGNPRGDEGLPVTRLGWRPSAVCGLGRGY
jgi:hypothetical protein